MPKTVRLLLALTYLLACSFSWYLVVNGDAHGEKGLLPNTGMLFNTVLAFPWSLTWFITIKAGIHTNLYFLITLFIASQLINFLTLWGMSNLRLIKERLLNAKSRH